MKISRPEACRLFNDLVGLRRTKGIGHLNHLNRKERKVTMQALKLLKTDVQQVEVSVDGIQLDRILRKLHKPVGSRSLFQQISSALSNVFYWSVRPQRIINTLEQNLLDSAVLQEEIRFIENQIEEKERDLRSFKSIKQFQTEYIKPILKKAEYFLEILPALPLEEQELILDAEIESFEIHIEEAKREREKIEKQLEDSSLSDCQLDELRKENDELRDLIYFLEQFLSLFERLSPHDNLEEFLKQVDITKNSFRSFIEFSEGTIIKQDQLIADSKKTIKRLNRDLKFFNDKLAS